MCSCGSKARAQSAINSAFIDISFISDVVDYIGTVTGRSYGTHLSGETIRIQIVDFDNTIMTQV